MSLFGIDTSKWQAGLPDKTIRADFIIFKATEGVGYTDPDCNPSYQEAKAAGKLLGVYHFARPDGNSALAEANYFVNQIKGYIGEAILVLDWETEPKGNVAWAKAWLDRVFALTGVRPLIYMSESVVNAYNWSSVANAGYGLWVAKYRDNNIDVNYDMSNAGAVPSIKWWPFYAMWQWTSSGRLSGWGGNLDCNIFYGDKAAWKKYASKVTATPAPVVVTKTESKATVIPFGRKVVEDATKTGDSITTIGVNGQRVITYSVTYTDGKETKRKVVSDVTKPAINQVITHGTYTPSPAETSDSPLDKENNILIKQILEIVNWIKDKFNSIFK